MFRSVWDRIHSVYTGPVLNWNGTVPHRITFVSGPILVPDSRSDPYRIHQVPCKHKAYPYQFRTVSKRIRSRVNAAYIRKKRKVTDWNNKKSGNRIIRELTPRSISFLLCPSRNDAASYHISGWCPRQSKHCSYAKVTTGEHKH